MASATITAIRKALGQQSVGIFGPPGSQQLQPVGVPTMGPDGNTAYSQNYAAAIREPDNALQTDALRVLASREGQANQRAQEAALKSNLEIAKVTANGEVLKAAAPGLVTTANSLGSRGFSNALDTDPVLETIARNVFTRGKTADANKSNADAVGTLFDRGYATPEPVVADMMTPPTATEAVQAPARPFGNYTGQQATDIEKERIQAEATTTAAALRGKEGGEDGITVTVTGDGSGPPVVQKKGSAAAFGPDPAGAVPMRTGMPMPNTQPTGAAPLPAASGSMTPAQRFSMIQTRLGNSGMYDIQLMANGRTQVTNKQTGTVQVF